MNKKGLIFILSSVGFITVILAVVGLVFNKSEYEKQQGLTEIYDVSSDNTIAYVVFDEGKPGIYIHGKENPVVELDNKKMIGDLTFSPDGSTLAYVVSDKIIEEEQKLQSVVYLLDMDTFETEELFNDPSLLTEITFDPKNKDSLFYLRAATFENYSPIARANPHSVDVFSYDLNKEKRTRYTTKDSYSMNSLTVSSFENAVYVQLQDDTNTKSAEDIFAAKQRIYKIPLDQPENMVTQSNKNRKVDIFDFAIVPNKPEMIFQSISNAQEGGTYEYELYNYNWETEEEKQLTNLGEYTSRPVISPKGEVVYFIVDKQFAKSESDYRLYRMDRNGENIKEIELDY
ncbi:hypothetical protein ACLIBG_05720 [Virgibacillus sp. W0181]|uniref:hypothetical protein n=1 Tax=Virgibacillus sp. W0181 TaxID=3391581 RepID=UPI003F48414B